MKKIQTLVPLLLLVIVMTGCIFGDDDKSSNSSPNSLIGTWEDWVTVFGERQRDTITFNKDGTFYFGTDYTNPVETVKIYGSYSISGSIVTLTYRENGQEFVDKYSFSVSGNTLTMKDVYSDFKMEYTKVKS